MEYLPPQNGSIRKDLSNTSTNKTTTTKKISTEKQHYNICFTQNLKLILFRRVKPVALVKPRIGNVPRFSSAELRLRSLDWLHSLNVQTKRAMELIVMDGNYDGCQLSEWMLYNFTIVREILYKKRNNSSVGG